MAANSSALTPHVAVVGESRAHGQRGISNPILGMILFIVSEVMFFAGLFAAYFNVRLNATQWPPFVNETAFAPFQIHHDIILTGSLTLILVLSSVTCSLGSRRSAGATGPASSGTRGSRSCSG